MRQVKFFLLMLICLVTFVAKAQVPFTPGNVVISRLGDGVNSYASLTAPVFLDEYTPSGVLVQSVPLPVADNGTNRKLTMFYPRGEQGYLTLSPNGKYLSLTGFDIGVNSPFGNLGSSVSRTIARVDYSANINTTTAVLGTDVTNPSIPIAVVTNNGSDFWSTHDGPSGGISARL